MFRPTVISLPHDSSTIADCPTWPMSSVPSHGGSVHMLKASAASVPDGVTSKSRPAQSGLPLKSVSTSTQYQPGPIATPPQDAIVSGTLNSNVNVPSASTVSPEGISISSPANHKCVISALPANPRPVLGKPEPVTVT